MSGGKDIIERLHSAREQTACSGLITCWNGPESYDLVTADGHDNATQFMAKLLSDAESALSLTRSELEAMKAELERKNEALAPFAAAARYYDEDPLRTSPISDDETVICGSQTIGSAGTRSVSGPDFIVPIHREFKVTMGDLRRARTEGEG